MGSVISKGMFKRNANGMFGILLWQCATTAALIELCNVSAGLFNGIICARFLGADEVAAIGLANPYYATVGLIGGMFYMGMRFIYANEVGRGNIPRANGAYTLALLLVVLVGGLCSALLFLFPEQVAVLFGAGNGGSELISLTAEHLRGLSIGIVPFMLRSMLASLMQLDGNRRIVDIGCVSYLFFVIGLDIVAVRLGMGIFGIGLATAIPYWIDVFILCTHFLRKNRILRLSFKTMEPRFLLDFLVLGSTVTVRKIYRIVTPLILNRLILAAGGAAAMSALAIQNSLLYVLVVYPVGIYDAVSLLAGMSYGERNKEALRRVAIVAQRHCMISSAIICVLVCVFSGPIAAFYVGTQGEIYHLTQIALVFAALTVLPEGLLYCKSNYLQTTHNVVKAQLLAAMMNFFFALFPAFPLVALFGSTGVLATYFTGMALSALCVHLYEMAKSRSLKPSLDVLLALPADFEVWPGDVIDLEIRDHGALALTLEQFDLFCKGHKLDARKALRARGCIEELCSLILDYGASQKASCIINLRVILEEEDIKICIRDSCKNLDLGKLAELIAADGDAQESKSGERLNLRMVMGLAKDVEFFNTFSTHTTQITI